MKSVSVLEQHIAVFGESGSGKTVMLSSFYGAAQEPQFLQQSLYRLVAEDIGQGARLHKNYLGMKNSAQVPVQDRFASTSYSFSVRVKDGDAKAAKAKPFDGLRLVWHDYPGEWFEQDVSGPEEAQRRVDTFRSLLASDIAVLLVDGQKLLDNAGEEERYLKSLLSNVGNGLLSLKDELLEEGKPLEEFPRIWMMALSKADLLPEMDVFQFRDLLVEKACDEMDELRKVLAEFVVSSSAMAVGQDFIVLSSAKFGTNTIEVTKRVGLDLLLPVAALLPLEKYVMWAEAKKIGEKAAAGLLDQAVPLAAVLIGRAAAGRLPGVFGVVAKVVVAAIGPEVFTEAAKLGEDKLRKLHDEAKDKHDNVTAVVTGFKLALNLGEKEQVLHRGLV